MAMNVAGSYRKIRHRGEVDKIMFVVMLVQDFEFEPVNFPLPVHVDNGKMAGFLPVYETREDALADYPDAELAEIRPKEKRREG